MAGFLAATFALGAIVLLIIGLILAWENRDSTGKLMGYSALAAAGFLFGVAYMDVAHGADAWPEWPFVKLKDMWGGLDDELDE